MKVINLTGHFVTVVDWQDRVVANYEPEPRHLTARPSFEFERTDPELLDRTMPIRDAAVSHITHLPEPEDDTIIITGTTTALLAGMLFDRDDVVCPDTGRTAVRDDNGKVIGVRRFLCYTHRVEDPAGGETISRRSPHRQESA
jgi:hypothetical protein